jgi:hypothetical protein
MSANNRSSENIKIGGSYMSLKDRTPRRRRIALGLGATAGGVLTAAFMSMGTAAAIPADDPFSDLGVTGSTGTTLDQGLNALNPTFASVLDGYVDNFPVAAGDADTFTELLGSAQGGPLDTAFPMLSADLAAFTDQLTDGANAGDPGAFGDLFGPGAAFLDTLFPALSVSLDPAYDSFDAVGSPFADLFGAAGTPIDSFVDLIPFGTTTLGGFLDSFTDAFVAAGV